MGLGLIAARVGLLPAVGGPDLGDSGPGDPGFGDSGLGGFGLLDGIVRHGFQIVGGIVVVLLVVIGVGIILGWRREKARRAAVSTWAKANGWTLTARDDSWVGQFAGPPFGVGDRRRADDVCRRRMDGVDQVAFTYRYVTYSTRTTTDANGVSQTTTETDHHVFQVVACRLAAVLGPLQIVPDSLGQRIAHKLGAQDIQIESVEFNRRYRVTAEDPKHAMDLLNPRTVERILSYPDVELRLRDGWALSWAPGALAPATADQRLAVLADVIAGVPRFVWNDRLAPHE